MVPACADDGLRVIYEWTNGKGRLSSAPPRNLTLTMELDQLSSLELGLRHSLPVFLHSQS